MITVVLILLSFLALHVPLRPGTLASQSLTIFAGLYLPLKYLDVDNKFLQDSAAYAIYVSTAMYHPWGQTHILTCSIAALLLTILMPTLVPDIFNMVICLVTALSLRRWHLLVLQLPNSMLLAANVRVLQPTLVWVLGAVLCTCLVQMTDPESYPLPPKSLKPSLNRHHHHHHHHHRRRSAAAAATTESWYNEEMYETLASHHVLWSSLTFWHLHHATKQLPAAHAVQEALEQLGQSQDEAERRTAMLALLQSLSTLRHGELELMLFMGSTASCVPKSKRRKGSGDLGEDALVTWALDQLFYIQLKFQPRYCASLRTFTATTPQLNTDIQDLECMVREMIQGEAPPPRQKNRFFRDHARNMEATMYLTDTTRRFTQGMPEDIRGLLFDARTPEQLLLAADEKRAQTCLMVSLPRWMATNAEVRLLLENSLLLIDWATPVPLFQLLYWVIRGRKASKLDSSYTPVLTNLQQLHLAHGGTGSSSSSIDKFAPLVLPVLLRSTSVKTESDQRVVTQLTFLLIWCHFKTGGCDFRAHALFWDFCRNQRPALMESARETLHHFIGGDGSHFRSHHPLLHLMLHSLDLMCASPRRPLVEQLVLAGMEQLYHRRYFLVNQVMADGLQRQTTTALDETMDTLAGTLKCAMGLYPLHCFFSDWPPVPRSALTGPVLLLSAAGPGGSGELPLATNSLLAYGLMQFCDTCVQHKRGDRAWAIKSVTFLLLAFVALLADHKYGWLIFGTLHSIVPTRISRHVQLVASETCRTRVTFCAQQESRATLQPIIDYQLVQLEAEKWLGHLTVPENHWVYRVGEKAFPPLMPRSVTRDCDLLSGGEPVGYRRRERELEEDSDDPELDLYLP